MTDARRYDADASRNAIIDAAARLFIEKGFDGASMSQLAKAAGVTKSLIHHHFGSKESLWDAVKVGLFAGYHEMQMAMLREGTPSEELLRQSIEGYFTFLRRNPMAVRLKSWLMLEEADDAHCEEMNLELMSLGVQRIREGQGPGGYIRPDIPAEFILVTFLSIVDGWFRSREPNVAALRASGRMRADQRLEDFDGEYLDVAIRIFFEGVRPPGRSQASEHGSGGRTTH